MKMLYPLAVAFGLSACAQPVYYYQQEPQCLITPIPGAPPLPPLYRRCPTPEELRPPPPLPQDITSPEQLRKGPPWGATDRAAPEAELPRSSAPGKYSREICEARDGTEMLCPN